MIKLSIVIPVYNEEERLEKTFTALKQGVVSDVFQISEVIFVDDGSRDNTKKLINTWIKQNTSKKTAYRLISYGENRGKGYAVKAGMLDAQGDYILFMDADMSTPLPELLKMQPVMLEKKDVIIGTRKNGHSTVIKHQPLYRELLGKAFTLLSNIITNTWVTDFTCGFKVFSHKAAQQVFSRARIERWGYDAEILFIAKNLGMSMKEVPVVWANDDRSKVNLMKALPQTLGELYTIRANAIKGLYNFKKGSLLSNFKPALQWLSTFI
ncbi:glycosyltransferase family 2 protein [Candidatus Roizmanbacteria bacterium]|nr:MAG: glycosyltransferase family 2 protein [Candidatus Roizmanbacteria bacterium]